MADKVWKPGEFRYQGTRSELAGTKGLEASETFNRDTGQEAARRELEIQRRFKTDDAREEARSFYAIEDDRLENNRKDHDEVKDRLKNGMDPTKPWPPEYARYYNEELEKERVKLERANAQARDATRVALTEHEALQSTIVLTPMMSQRLLAYRPELKQQLKQDWGRAASGEGVEPPSRQPPEKPVVSKEETEKQTMWAELLKTTPMVRTFDQAASGRTEQAQTVSDDGRQPSGQNGEQKPDRSREEAEMQALWSELAKTTPMVQTFDRAASERAEPVKTINDDGGRTR